MRSLRAYVRDTGRESTATVGDRKCGPFTFSDTGAAGSPAHKSQKRFSTVPTKGQTCCYKAHVRRSRGDCCVTDVCVTVAGHRKPVTESRPGTHPTPFRRVKKPLILWHSSCCWPASRARVWHSAHESADCAGSSTYFTPSHVSPAHVSLRPLCSKVSTT